jgi:hypothetical protein
VPSVEFETKAVYIKHISANIQQTSTIKPLQGETHTPVQPKTLKGKELEFSTEARTEHDLEIKYTAHTPEKMQQEVEIKTILAGMPRPVPPKPATETQFEFMSAEPNNKTESEAEYFKSISDGLLQHAEFKSIQTESFKPPRPHPTTEEEFGFLLSKPISQPELRSEYTENISVEMKQEAKNKPALTEHPCHSHRVLQRFELLLTELTI